MEEFISQSHPHLRGLWIKFPLDVCMHARQASRRYCNIEFTCEPDVDRGPSETGPWGSTRTVLRLQTLIDEEPQIEENFELDSPKAKVLPLLRSTSPSAFLFRPSSTSNRSTCYYHAQLGET